MPFSFFLRIGTGGNGALNGMDQYILSQQFLANQAERPKQIWEQGWYKQVFGKRENPAADYDVIPHVKIPRREETFVGQAEPQFGISTGKRKHDYVKERIHLARLIKTDDVVRHGALRKFRDIVLCDIEMSQLGKSLTLHASGFCDEAKLQAIFASVFSNKATSTLTKRVNLLWQLHAWLYKNGTRSLFRITEHLLFEYLTEIKSTGRGATVGRQVLQSVTFFFHMVDADKRLLADLMSSRNRGLADAMMSEKAPLKQAKPLPVDLVHGLEELMYKLVHVHERVICGHLIFCIFACCRFGDSVDLASLELNTAGDFYLVEAFSKHYKMGNSEKKRMFLPLVAIGQGLYEAPWAPKWMQARESAKIPLHFPTMPAWSETEWCWVNRPMSTGEGCAFLRELLSRIPLGHDFDPQDFSCHSAKATMLSWMAKSNLMTFDDRRLLGHHLCPGAASTLTYSRDEMTRLQKTVFTVLRLIRSGEFDPDLSRVERLRQMVGIDDYPEEDMPEGEDEEFACSEVAESDIDIEDVLQVQAEQIETLEPEQHEGLVMHHISSVVHLVTGSKLACGRKLGAAYRSVPLSKDLKNLPFCSQCDNSNLDTLRQRLQEPHDEPGSDDHADVASPSWNEIG